MEGNAMPFVDSDQARLYFEEVGAGYPIIFVHEFAADCREWEPQLRFFSRSYRCIAYNARGYPPSDVPGNPDHYGWEFAADDIAAVMNGLSIERAHVVGLSMGGYAALQFGPTAGILTGAIAGMSQDALSGGIVGVGGLAKTIVGFLAGTLGSQFIVTNPLPRFVVLLLGAALKAIGILGLSAVIDKHGLSIPWRTAWPQMLLTAFVGIILIQAVQAIPGILMRRRLRRGY